VLSLSHTQSTRSTQSRLENEDLSNDNAALQAPDVELSILPPATPMQPTALAALGTSRDSRLRQALSTPALEVLFKYLQPDDIHEVARSTGSLNEAMQQHPGFAEVVDALEHQAEEARNLTDALSRQAADPNNLTALEHDDVKRAYAAVVASHGLLTAANKYRAAAALTCAETAFAVGFSTKAAVADPEERPEVFAGIAGMSGGLALLMGAVVRKLSHDVVREREADTQQAVVANLQRLNGNLNAAEQDVTLKIDALRTPKQNQHDVALTIHTD